MSEQQGNRAGNTRGTAGPGFGRGPAMGMPVQKARNFRGTLKRLLSYLHPFRYRLILVVAAALLSTAFSIVSPKIMGKATTSLFTDLMRRLKGVPGATVNFDYILHILSILAVLYVFSSAFAYLQQYLMAGVAQKTVYRLRKEVNEKLARLPLKYFDSHTNGEILSRVLNDVDNVSTTLQQSLTQFITSLSTILGVIIMMLTISPLLALIVLLTLPLSLFLTKGVATRSQKYFAGQQKALGILNGHVEEMYTGHKVVKAFGHETKSLAKFDEINNRLFQSAWKAQFISGIIMPMMNFVANIGYVLVSVAGGLLVTKKAIEIGDVQAFIQYTRQFSWPINQLANSANIIQSTIASAERVFELLDEKEETLEAQFPRELKQPRGNVTFHDVGFSYDPQVALIKGLNIEVEEGQTIAIVGPTGAGKTTLVNLLMRFYELDDGQITIDGVDLREMTRGHLRSLFGMVLQDTWLFNGTIRENIGYGRPGATEEQILQAARAAHADHFIRTLPEGYDTVLNEDASNISQGQKQLLTIARAILADPPILILDEATSSVDTRTEVYIQKAMHQLMTGRTSFVIAHRLSTIRDADLILVMNNGHVIEQGSHEQLLARQGFYAELYQSQFSHSAPSQTGQANN